MEQRSTFHTERPLQAEPATRAGSRIDQKRVATVAARCALAGITMHCIESDLRPRAFIVTRWALTREFHTLDDVDSWLDTVAPAKAGTTL